MKLPSFECKRRPSTTGASTCKQSLMMVSNNSAEPPVSSIKKLIHMGVIKIPMILEMLALKIAADKFPPAMDINTTDDETVDGKAAR